MTGLLVVAVLIVLIIVLAALALRPGGGLYINEKTARVIRELHRERHK